MAEMTCKLLIIGAGPGGYVCAIRAGQLGIDTVVVEAANPGGTCLNIGCIPSKALIHAAQEFATVTAAARGTLPGITASAPKLELAQVMGWKDGIVGKLTTGVSSLLTRAGVRVVRGGARFLNGKAVAVATAEGEVVIHAEAVVIATGSEPVELPFLPFGGAVISSTEALALTELPANLVVVGGGYIGLELGTAFAKLGAKVTIVESAARVLPQYDAALTRPIVKHLAQLGVEVLTGARAVGMAGAALRVEIGGTERLLPADRVLVTVGRSPRSAIAAPLALDMSGPFLAIDDRCRTSMTGVYAIGDVTGEPMLAHRAMAQGEMVAELVAGLPRRWDKRAIPAICFTDPELVTAGLSPDHAGEGALIGEFPFAANGRALTLGAGDGFVRIVARADNHLILGFQAVGAGMGELAASFGLALEAGLRLEDIAGTIHAHPTLGEAVQEAALRALGHALHI